MICGICDRQFSFSIVFSRTTMLYYMSMLHPFLWLSMFHYTDLPHFIYHPLMDMWVVFNFGLIKRVLL